MGLVTTQWLSNHLAAAGSERAIRVCDVRWYLPATGRYGRREYEAGHLPGAVFVDLDLELAAPDDGRAGRHPLPAAEVFEAAMRRAGVDGDTHVVAYDDAGGSTAARLWWLLRAHGHEKVSLLDGGLPQWKQEGRPLAIDIPAPAPGDFVSRWRPEAALDLEGTRAALRTGALLLDARGRDRYRGDTEPVDPRPGHVPGALSAPFAESLDGGRFLAPEPLRDRFARLAPAGRDVIASCGSGVTACHLLFALDLTGVRPFPAARLYTGSYSEWSRHTELPVAMGEAPGTPV